ncbi:MAG: Flp pilus assembly complex ATPase component TadA [Bifidobacterium sp.]|jgi:pilus assembly protein CpaF|nr:Flp pilus assembly complex ATPase component TadA [Bifidobacterium sp.]MCI1864746.1 Flp pilus assembly complex ATPase component TadA [Bifidobacterium sp.]
MRMGWPENEATGESRDALNLGPLSDLADVTGISDIAVNYDGRIWVDYGDGMREYMPSIPFRPPQAIRRFAVQLCAQLGRRLDDACPIADASNGEGVRVHAVIAPLVPYGAAISIRLPSRETHGLERLCAGGMFPLSLIPLLTGLVRGGANVMITGGTGTGKTTLLKALLAQCDPRERIVSVEEIRELGSIGTFHHVSLTTREPNTEGTGGVTLADLVKATLRMRPDRVVLGECRGEEIADLLRAFNSGHRGGFVTLHADGVELVPARLVALGLLAGLSPQTTESLARGAFDAIIHLDRCDGRRRLLQIGVLDMRRDRLIGRVIARAGGGGMSFDDGQWERFLHRWTPGVNDVRDRRGEGRGTI